MHWDAQRYLQQHGFIIERGQALVDLLAPRAGERILDLACGYCPDPLPLSLKASHTAAVMRSPFSAQVPPRLLDCPQTLWVTPVTTCVQDIQVKILYAVYSAA